MISMEKRNLSDEMNYLVDLEAQKIIQVGKLQNEFILQEY